MMWLIYLFVFITGGILIWEFILPNRRLIETVLLGALFGMILSSGLPFIFTFEIVFERAVYFSIFLMVLVIMFLAYFEKKAWQLKFQNFFKTFNFKNIKTNPAFALWVVFFVILLLYLPLGAKILFNNEDSWYTTGFRSAYGDVPFHLMYLTSFAWGDNFLPENPDFASTVSNYPFLPYIASSVLVKLGADLIQGFMVPVFILSFLIIALLIYVPWRITGKVGVGILVPLIFLLSGGVGFWWFLQAHGFDILSSENLLGSGVIDEATSIPSKNINLLNFMLSSLLPQRGVLFGVPIFLAVVLLWFQSTKRSILASSLLVGSLPLFHPHTFITLMIIFPFLVLSILITKKSFLAIKDWFWFLLIVGIAVIFTAKFISPAIYKSLAGLLPFLKQGAGESGASFIRFTKGWMLKGDGFIWYWLRNLGLFLPVLLVALFSKKIPNKLKIWYLPFIPVFIIGNLVIFSPWEWDNHKFFTLWYLVSAFLVAYLLIELFLHRYWAFKVIAFILLILIILSGTIDAFRLWKFAQKGWGLFSPQDQKLAEFIKENTLPKSIFITSPDHNSPIILSGRKRYLGYLGWLWAHGLDYGERQQKLELMYSGSGEVKSLLENEKINYILIGPHEINDFAVNISFFEENYKKVYDQDGYKLFFRDNK